MSKILVKIVSNGASASLISDLRKTLHLSIGEIKNAIDNNKILKEYQLYGNDQEEVEYELLKLLHEVRRAGARIQIFEYLYDEDVDLENLNSHEISEEILRNMLHRWNDTINNQSIKETDEDELNDINNEFIN